MTIVDPDATLAELRRMVIHIRAVYGPLQRMLAPELAEQFDILDEWLTRGGFLPAAWRGGPEKRG